MTELEMGFDDHYLENCQIYLETFSARFQLKVAHLEFKELNHGGWLAGSGSSTAHGGGATS